MKRVSGNRLHKAIHLLALTLRRMLVCTYPPIHCISFPDVADFLTRITSHADITKEFSQLEARYQELTKSLSTSVHDHYDAFITTSRHVKGMLVHSIVAFIIIKNRYGTATRSSWN